MRIYSDTLDRGGVCDALSDARAEVGLSVHMDINGFSERARKRKYRTDISLEGTGPHHTRRRNSGVGGSSNYWHGDDTYAATWMEWGWLIAVCFRFDPHAVIGQYDGVEDFHRQTSGGYLKHRLRVDRSVRNFARQYAAWWDGESSPFTLVDRICPPNKLVNLRDTGQVEAWLGEPQQLVITDECAHCHRHLIRDPQDGWVDPEATGDDVLWRETCEAREGWPLNHDPIGGK